MLFVSPETGSKLSKTSHTLTRVRIQRGQGNLTQAPEGIIIIGRMRTPVREAFSYRIRHNISL